MKPILFPSDATTFTTNGLGSLDPTSCVVTEERNGQYELECVVPVESPHFDEIHNNMILVVIPGDGGSVHPVSQRQAFRIYHVTEPLNGLVTLSARHISYDLSYNTVMPTINAGSITTAFSAIVANMVETNRFTFDTDKSTAATFKVNVPQTARQLLGGQSGSILDVYGGEYQWDNWRVCLWNQRGTDTDVTLRYGKNITDLTQEENLENVVTGIVPYWASEDETLTLPEKSIDSQYASQYPYKRTVPVDFSSEWEEKPPVASLRSRAQSYVTANRLGIPKVSIKVSFVALWQTEEYKDIAPLEKVHLCDTVGVVFEKYNINTRAEVIKTEWDCLAERYLSIELGEPRANFARTIVNMNDQTTQEIVEAKTDMQKAIDAATAAITGVKGGNIKFNFTADGKPYEQLIMDHDDESEAVVIWRYNLGGWGVSTDGGRTYGMAATLNPVYGAAINADYIIVGTMLANRIKGGTLTLGGTEANKGDGSVDIYDANNNKIATIDKNGFAYGNDNFKVDASGNLTMKQGSIQLGIPGNGSFWVVDGVATFDTAILSNIYIPGGTDCDFKFNEDGFSIVDPDDADHALARLTGGSDTAGHTGVALLSSSGNSIFVQSSDTLMLSGSNGVFINGELKPTSDTTGKSGELTLRVGQKITLKKGVVTNVDTSGEVSGWTGTLNGIGDSSGNYYCDVYVSKGLITGWSGWQHV